MDSSPPRPSPESQTPEIDPAWARELARALTQDERTDAAARAGLHRDPAPALSSSWFARLFLRRSGGGSARPDGAKPPRGPLPSAQEFEAQRLLSAALEALEEPMRTTVVRRYVRGLALTEIARLDGVAEATVRARLAHGLELLRADLDRRQRGGRDAWRALLAVLVEREHRPLVATAAASGLGLGALGWLGALAFLGAVAFAVLERDERGPDVLARAEGATAYANPERADDATPTLAPSAAPGSTTALRAPGAADVERGLPPGVAYRVRGRVVDHADRPIADARLTTENGSLLLLDSGRLRGQERLRGWAGPTATRTDARGEFVLDLAPQRASAELSAFAPGATPTLGFTVVARAPGFAPTTWGGTLYLGEERDLGTLRAARGRSIEGRVTARGEELEGAQVSATWPELEPTQRTQWPWVQFGARQVLARTTTDAEGRYRLDGVAAPNARVFAAASGFDERASPALALRDDAPVAAPDLELRPWTACVRGHVVDANGVPVARASVSASAPDHRYRLVTATDEQGAFEFALVAAEPHDLAAWGSTAQDGRAFEAGVASTRSDVRLVLRRERTVGLAIRATDGRPIARCRVFVNPVGGGSGREYRLEDGARGLEFELPPMPFQLRALADDCETRFVEFQDAAQVGARIELELQRQPLVRGLVVDARGVPVPRAQVRLLHRSAEPGTGELRELVPGTVPTYGFSDDDGAFVLGRSPGHAWQVRAEDATLGAGESDVRLPSEPDASLRIVLRPFGAVRGRVLADDPAQRRDAWFSLLRGDGWRESARVDEAGRFEFPDVAEGSWQIVLETYDPELALLRVCRTDLAPVVVQVESGRTTDVDFDLARRGQCALQGNFRFVGEEDELWTVALAPVPARIVNAQLVAIAPSGDFELAASAPGSAWIVARCEARDGCMRELRWPVELAAGPQRRALAIDTVELEVRAPGRGGAELLHRWHRDDGATLETRFLLPANGTHPRLRLPCGTGTFHAVTPSGLERSEPLVQIELRADTPRTLELPRDR
ncbi:MAG: carboxypeptidase regulatory-like domain-containing protein [Planctomycetes bacterium]|nr:carboxypeptidase regulatory-like domain-containing protein [Planctomycetota bacterium]